MFRPLSFLFACAALAAGVALPRAASAQVDVEIYDRTDGRTLPVHYADGRRWIAGEPRHEYGIRLRNQTGERVLAVVSVDGVNVVTGQTASPAQSGYVLGPWQSTTIEGWRKNLDRVAAFYFTALPNSYAARTGRPGDVGVIGVAVFRERAAPVAMLPPEPPYVGRDDAAAPYARSAPPAAPASAPPSADRAAAAESNAAGAVAQRRADSARAKAELADGALAERLGTGHGRRIDSRVEWTDFERASDRPDCVLAFNYDSRRNLVALGVLPPERYARTPPNPFPAGFVPDPR